MTYFACFEAIIDLLIEHKNKHDLFACVETIVEKLEKKTDFFNYIPSYQITIVYL